MTIGQDNAIATPAPGAEPKPNSFQRIIGVLFSPDATFASIARRPDWVVPLVLLLLVVARGRHHHRAARRLRRRRARGDGAEQERLAGADRPSGKDLRRRSARCSTYISPVLSLIGLLVIAGVLLLAFRLFGGEGDFKQAFSVDAATPRCRHHQEHRHADHHRGEGRRSSPRRRCRRSSDRTSAFSSTTRRNPMAFALLSSFDIFSIWFLALLIIGFAYVARVSKAKAAVDRHQPLDPHAAAQADRSGAAVAACQ